MPDPSYDKVLFDSVNDIVVHHPKLVEAKRYADQLLKLGPYRDEAPCTEISGPAGVGKSTLWNWIKDEQPTCSVFESVKVARGPAVLVGRRPVITVKLAEEPTVVTICELFLEALGDPMTGKGTVRDKTHRVDVLLHLCGVSVIFIDEFQYVVDRTGIVSAENIVDWLRDRHMRASRSALGFSDARSIALCFIGLGRLGAIFSGDSQRLRRWDAGWRMSPYGREGEDLDDFAGIVSAFVEACALRTDTKLDFDDPRLIERFHYATWGIAGGLKKLFAAAMRIAALAPDHYPTLSLRLFERAFDLQIRVDEYPVVELGHGAGIMRPPIPMQNSFGTSFDANRSPPLPIDDRDPIAPLSRRRATSKSKRLIEEASNRAFASE